MGDANPSAWQLQEDGCLAATPLRSLTDSPLLMPARLCFAPPSLPESLGVAAGACAVRWPLGALAQSPAGCPPPLSSPVHPGHRTPARTAGPQWCCAAVPPPPPPPSPSAGGSGAVAIRALPCAGLRPRCSCRCLRPRGGRRRRLRLRLPLPSAAPSAGRLGECQRRGGRGAGRGASLHPPRSLSPGSAPFPLGSGLPLRGTGLPPVSLPGSHLLLTCLPGPNSPSLSPS